MVSTSLEGGGGVLMVVEMRVRFRVCVHLVLFFCVFSYVCD